jgi:predicted RNA-binding Zn-ribbon protein involved in translation (DUF1610 family)
MEDKKKLICNECECEIKLETTKELAFCPVCGEEDIYVIYETEREETDE